MVSMKKGETREQHLKRSRERQATYRANHQNEINEKQRIVWHENREENNRRQRERYKNLSPEELKIYKENIKTTAIIRKTNIKKIVNKYKAEGCSICGYNKCLEALDFHHKDNEDKDFAISLMVKTNRPMKKVIEELAKCIVLCANCHRELHWKERQIKTEEIK